MKVLDSIKESFEEGNFYMLKKHLSYLFSVFGGMNTKERNYIVFCLKEMYDGLGESTGMYKDICERNMKKFINYISMRVFKK